CWALAIAIGNTLEAVLAVFLVRRFAHGTRAFLRARGILVFAIVAGLVSPVLSASVGTTALALAGLASCGRYGPLWLTWWLGDGAGALLFAPALILWAAPDALAALRHRWGEAGAILVTVVLVGLFVFGGISPRGYPLSFLPFPVLLWPALRFGSREVALATLVLMVMAILGTARAAGPFGDL